MLPIFNKYNNKKKIDYKNLFSGNNDKIYTFVKKINLLLHNNYFKDLKIILEYFKNNYPYKNLYNNLFLDNNIIDILKLNYVYEIIEKDVEYLYFHIKKVLNFH